MLIITSYFAGIFQVSNRSIPRSKSLSFRVNEKRIYPSPYSPYPDPGVTTRSFSSNNAVANSAEVNPSGILTQIYSPALGGMISRPIF